MIESTFDKTPETIPLVFAVSDVDSKLDFDIPKSDKTNPIKIDINTPYATRSKVFPFSINEDTFSASL